MEVEQYPSEDEPSPEEMAFLKSLGWKEDEIVPPLKQEEIADCVSFVMFLILVHQHYWLSEHRSHA
jgi:hypothetical protein